MKHCHGALCCCTATCCAAINERRRVNGGGCLPARSAGPIARPQERLTQADVGLDLLVADLELGHAGLPGNAIGLWASTRQQARSAPTQIDQAGRGEGSALTRALILPDAGNSAMYIVQRENHVARWLPTFRSSFLTLHAVTRTTSFLDIFATDTIEAVGKRVKEGRPGAAARG